MRFKTEITVCYLFFCPPKCDSYNLVLLPVHKWFVFFLQQKLWIHSFSISVLCKHHFSQHFHVSVRGVYPANSTSMKPSWLQICRSLKSETTCFSFHLYSKTTKLCLDLNRTSNSRTFTAGLCICATIHFQKEMIRSHNNKMLLNNKILLNWNIF